MRKQSEKKAVVSTIIISAFFSLLVLGALSFFIIFYIIPNQVIAPEVLYSVLVRLLPMLIGLIMVIIALIMYPPQVPKDTESEDELELDAYTAPLYNLPQEEESLDLGRPQLAVEEVEMVSPPAEQTIQPVVLPKITPFLGRQDYTPFSQRKKPDIFQPVDYSKTVVEPTILEQELSEITEEDSFDPLERLKRPVLFAEYPYPITPGSEIAQLLEPIGESTIAADEELVLLSDTFDNRYEAELTSAQELGYELTIAIIIIPSSPAKAQAVNASAVQNLFNQIGLVSFFYLTEENTVSAILPFHGFAQSRRYFASLLESLRKHDPLSAIKIGFSTLQDRSIEPQELLREATVAAEQAAQRKGYSVIAYDPELEV
ncbi:MAG: hypothetical protein WCS59_05900 [Sphaerochaetaceae bacterium]|jgi:hypothetical protein